MRRRVQAFVVAGGIAFLTASRPSPAFVVGEEAITVVVPFEFTIGDRSFPAGSYRVGHRVGPFQSLQLSSEDGKVRMPVLAVVRLPRRRTPDAPKASLVFDKVSDRLVLSEVWLPERDGFRLRSTKEKHERVIVGAKD
jgi:hypothetical protein